MKDDYVKLQYPHHKSYYRCWRDRQSWWKILLGCVALYGLAVCEWFGPVTYCLNATEWWLDLYPDVALVTAVPYMLYKLCINK